MRIARWSTAALAAFLAPTTAQALSVGWEHEPVHIPTSGRAKATAVIDINRDGRDELITSADRSGIQIWTLDNDDWRPVGAPGLPTDGEFVKLIVADLDHDGFQDLVALQADGQAFAFHYRPSVNDWVEMAIPDANYTDIAVDDLDLDGRVDILGVGPIAGVHRTSFDGQRWVETETFLWQNAYSRIAVGRLFQDAVRDIALVRANGAVETWRAVHDGDEKIQWKAEPFGLQLDPVSAVTTVDFDLDGRDELILVTTSGIRAIDWFPSGWVSRSTGLTNTSQTTHVAVGDVNRDGTPDIFESGSGGRAFLWAPSQGRWLPQQQQLGRCYGPISILDFDGDGHTDVACSDGYKLHVWRHSGLADPLNQWEALRVPYDSGSSNDVVGEDLDLDGAFDVAAGSEGGLELSLASPPAWMGGSWTQCPQPTALPQLRLESARLHRWDSYRDLVALSDNGVHVIRNDGACNWREVDFYQGTFSALAVGDLDNDGFDEIAVAADDIVLLLRFSEGQLEYFGEEDVGWTINDLAIGDLDQDGQRDIVAATSFTVVALLNKTGAFKRYILPDAKGHLRVAIGDVDGDGIPDVVAGGDGVHTFGISVWFRSNDYRMLGEYCSVPALALGDLTGDAGREIAVHYDAPCSDQWIHVYTHEGMPVGEPIETKPVKNLRIVDLDRDGENDILAATTVGAQAWGNRDSRAPVIQLHSFDPDHWIRTGSPVVEASVHDAGSGLNRASLLCQYTDGDDTWRNCPSLTLTGTDGSTDEESLTTDEIPFSQGVYLKRLRIRIADQAGNVTDVTWNLQLDSAPPSNPTSFTIDSANGRASFAGGTDWGGSGIEWFEACLVIDPRATNCVGWWILPSHRRWFDLTGIPEGRYYLRIRTGDSSGLWSIWTHLGPEYYDRTPPSTPNVFTSTPAAGTWVRTGTISARWTAGWDSGSGVASHYYKLDTNPTTELASGRTGWTPITDTSVSVNVANLPEGKHWLHVAAEDRVGNISGTAHHGFIGVDRTAPRLLWFYIGNGMITQDLSRPLPISWSVSDALSGVSSVTMTMGKQERSGSSVVWDPAFTVSSTDSWTLSFLQPAYAYHFQLRALDHAGNVSEWTHMVYHRPTPPILP